MLRLEKMSCGYGAIRAVEDLSFDLPAGALLALLGPNGAGKTSTMMAIMGHTTIFGGKIVFEGKDITREPAVKRAARGIAFFTFEELCDRPLGAADYLAIAECFSTVLIDGVPPLSAERRDETARFTTLIDALYEAKTKLFMAAASAPEQLAPAGEWSFAFQRTASRLIEMQSEEYRQKPHLG